jgi:hypothetical protein
MFIKPGLTSDYKCLIKPSTNGLPGKFLIDLNSSQIFYAKKLIYLKKTLLL